MDPILDLTFSSTFLPAKQVKTEDPCCWLELSDLGLRWLWSAVVSAESGMLLHFFVGVERLQVCLKKDNKYRNIYTQET